MQNFPTNDRCDKIITVGDCSHDLMEKVDLKFIFYVKLKSFNATTATATTEKTVPNIIINHDQFT